VEKAPIDNIAEIIAKLPKGTIGLTDPEYYQKRLAQAYTKADEILPLLNLAYCAGVVDGEGWIGIARKFYERHHVYDRENGCFHQVQERDVYYTPSLSVNMTSKLAIDILGACLYGSVDPTTKKDKRLTKSGKMRKEAFRFHSHSRKLVKTIDLLLPYLKVKKPQAELILEFYTLPKIHWSLPDKQKDEIKNAQRLLFEKMKVLNG